MTAPEAEYLTPQRAAELRRQGPSVEIETEKIVSVHLNTGEVVYFENGVVTDGPAVLHDSTGPIVGCEFCDYSEGFPEGVIGEALARQAVYAHRCGPIQEAIDALAKEADERVAATARTLLYDHLIAFDSEHAPVDPRTRNILALAVHLVSHPELTLPTIPEGTS
jgi:hypothetical protein